MDFRCDKAMLSFDKLKNISIFGIIGLRTYDELCIVCMYVVENGGKSYPLTK